MDEDTNKEEPEDSSIGQLRKTYKARTELGKAMVKMQRHFCQLLKANANAIVVYFGTYGKNKLANFQQMHWKDTFSQ